MAFIGNTNTTQAFTPAVDFFSGDASTTAFTLSRPVASVAQVQAVISNVPQDPGSAYTVSGNTITFTSAPLSGTNNIYVYYTSPITQVIAPGQGTVTSESFGAIVNFTTTGNTVLGDASTDTLNVGNGGLVKDASGNVGIGTASPRATFDVTNATNTGYGAIIEKTAGSGTPNGLFVSTGQNSASNFIIKAAVGTFASSTDAFVVDGTGALKFNSGYGSAATAYGCRAWVNFDGTGTVAIRGSGNVSSITDNGTGDYTVNFTTAMPDTSYCGVALPNDGSPGTNLVIACENSTRTKTTSAFNIWTAYGGNGVNKTLYDVNTVNVSIFR